LEKATKNPIFTFHGLSTTLAIRQPEGGECRFFGFSQVSLNFWSFYRSKGTKSLDMKRFSAFFVIVLVTVFVFSCSKHSSGPSAGYGPNSLFPTTNGDTWYFQDSAFTDSALSWTNPDTMVATKTAIQDNTGTVYLGMNNPNGWFDGAYIAVDPSNDAVYEADSISGYQPYTLLALVNQDGPIGPRSMTIPMLPVRSSISRSGMPTRCRNMGIPVITMWS